MTLRRGRFVTLYRVAGPLQRREPRRRPRAATPARAGKDRGDGRRIAVRRHAAASLLALPLVCARRRLRSGAASDAPAPAPEPAAAPPRQRRSRRAEPAAAAPEAAAEPAAARRRRPRSAAGGGSAGRRRRSRRGGTARRCRAEAAPGFDVVRVEPDGSAAVAGTAAPGREGDDLSPTPTPLAEAEADAEGNFVAMFKVEPSAAPRALTLEATPAGGGAAATLGRRGDAAAAGARGRAVRAGAVPDARAPAAAPRVASRRRSVARRGRPSRDRRAAAAAAGEPAAAPARRGGGRRRRWRRRRSLRGDSVEVLPAPRGPDAALTLASISYTEAGEVTLAGVGTAGSALRAYVDDRFAAGGGGRRRRALERWISTTSRGALPAAHRPARRRRQGGEPGRDAVPARLSARAAAAARAQPAGGRRPGR